MENLPPQVGSKLHVDVVGDGPAIVLIHGWGLNAGVWHRVVKRLAVNYRVYTVDLPGFGFSHQCVASDDLAQWSALVVASIPEPAVWLGWSLGGLVVTQIALDYPDRVTKLITVASSPKFVGQDQWAGIDSAVLAAFQEQLKNDFNLTLKRFLAIQAMGSDSAKQDIKALHQILNLRPLPSAMALKNGLNLLGSVDLRNKLTEIKVPFLRMYGRLDSLVPLRAVTAIDKLINPDSKYIFLKASHAPFISHCEEFVAQIENFVGSN